MWVAISSKVNLGSFFLTSPIPTIQTPLLYLSDTIWLVKTDITPTLLFLGSGEPAVNNANMVSALWTLHFIHSLNFCRICPETILGSWSYCLHSCLKLYMLSIYFQVLVWDIIRMKNPRYGIYTIIVRCRHYHFVMFFVFYCIFIYLKIREQIFYSFVFPYLSGR